MDGSFPTISKVDEHTLNISFSRTVGVGLRGLDSLSILPRHRLQKAYQNGSFSSAWGPSALPEEIVGIGPFRLKEYQPGVRVVLERNPYYWKKDKTGRTLPYLDTITFLIIPDRGVEALKFKAGEIDVIGGALDPDNFAGLRRSQAQGNYRVQDLGPGLDLDFLWFNLNPGSNKAGRPYLDPEKRALFEKSQFRRAISHALDREAMARSLFLGLGTPHYGPVGPGNKTWNNPALPQTNFDPARARQMLLATGLKDSNNDGILELSQNRPLEILLLTSRGNTRRERMTQIIKDNLAKVGLRVTTQSLDTRDLILRIVSSFEYEAMLFGFTTTDVAPDIQADLWLSSGSNHFWYPNQPKPATAWEKEIDALTAELVRTQDNALRKNPLLPNPGNMEPGDAGGSHRITERPRRLEDEGRQPKTRNSAAALNLECRGVNDWRPLVADLPIVRILTFLARRTLQLVAVAFLAVSVTFLLASLIPGDFFTLLEADPAISRETIEGLRQEYRLGEPFHLQYFHWIQRSFHLDLGYSLFYGRPVAKVIGDALVRTLWLGTPALFFGLLAGVFVGTLHALHHERPLGYLLDVVSSILLSLPSLVLGLLAILLASHTQWFPVGGAGSVDHPNASMAGQFLDRHSPSGASGSVRRLAHLCLGGTRPVFGGAHVVGRPLPALRAFTWSGAIANLLPIPRPTFSESGSVQSRPIVCRNVEHQSRARTPFPLARVGQSDL